MNKEEKYSTLRIVIFGGQKQKDRKAVEIKDRREKTERQKPPLPHCAAPLPIAAPTHTGDFKAIPSSHASVKLRATLLRVYKN